MGSILVGMPLYLLLNNSFITLIISTDAEVFVVDDAAKLVNNARFVSATSE
jgi:hypothetical protein